MMLSHVILVSLIVIALPKDAAGSISRCIHLPRAPLCSSRLRARFPQYFCHCPTTEVCTYGSWSAWRLTGVRKSTSKTICDSQMAQQQERNRTGSAACKVRIDKQTQYTCACTYGSWSSWKLTGVKRSTSNTTCDTGMALQQERNRTGSAACRNRTDKQTKYTCLPTYNEQAVILTTVLRLGQNVYREFNATGRGRRAVACPTSDQQKNNEICRNDFSCDTDDIGKRSVPIEDINEKEVILSLEEGISVEKFSIEDFKNRRRRQIDCNEERVIIIILDVSGSISSQDFNELRQLIATIAERFCGYIQVAVVSYSHKINLDFCSNCYSYDARADMKDAILNIYHRGGSTHTGRALKCVGEEVVKPTGICLLSSDIKNIDIVTITDGKHNGPCTDDIQDIVKALDKTALNVKRYVIAYGNFQQSGLNSLASAEDTDHVFYLEIGETLHLAVAIASEVPGCLNHTLCA